MTCSQRISTTPAVSRPLLYIFLGFMLVAASLTVLDVVRVTDLGKITYLFRPRIPLANTQKAELVPDITAPAKTCIFMGKTEGYSPSFGLATEDGNRAWAQKQHYTFEVFTHNENPYFFRYIKAKELLESTSCIRVMWLDYDCVNIDHDWSLPKYQENIVFGNEFHFGWLGKSAVNSGIMILHRSPETTNFLHLLLTSCPDCMAHSCGMNFFRDQGCIDRLLQKKKFNSTGYATIQTDHCDGSRPFFHATGHGLGKQLLTKCLDGDVGKHL